MKNPGSDASITLQFATLYVLQPHLMFLDPTLHFAALYVLWSNKAAVDFNKPFSDFEQNALNCILSY